MRSGQRRCPLPQNVPLSVLLYPGAAVPLRPLSHRDSHIPWKRGWLPSLYHCIYNASCRRAPGQPVQHRVIKSLLLQQPQGVVTGGAAEHLRRRTAVPAPLRQHRPSGCPCDSRRSGSGCSTYRRQLYQLADMTDEQRPSEAQLPAHLHRVADEVGGHHRRGGSMPMTPLI